MSPASSNLKTITSDIRQLQESMCNQLPFRLKTSSFLRFCDLNNRTKLFKKSYCQNLHQFSCCIFHKKNVDFAQILRCQNTRNN